MFRILVVLCCLGGVFGPPPDREVEPAEPDIKKVGPPDPEIKVPVPASQAVSVVFLAKNTDTCWDFSAGIQPNAPVTGTGVTWTQQPYNDNPCAVRGVLKLTPPGWATQLKVHMRIIKGTGWQFNLGDSPTNNGYSGDGGTAPVGYNAEFQKLNEKLTLYKGISFPQPAIVEEKDLGHSHELSIRVKRGFAWATNYDGWMLATCRNENRLFSWDDMYLGINRVVYNPQSTSASGNRVGQGLCKLCIEWE